MWMQLTTELAGGGLQPCSGVLAVPPDSLISESVYISDFISVDDIIVVGHIKGNHLPVSCSMSTQWFYAFLCNFGQTVVAQNFQA